MASWRNQLNDKSEKYKLIMAFNIYNYYSLFNFEISNHLMNLKWKDILNIQKTNIDILM